MTDLKETVERIVALLQQPGLVPALDHFIKAHSKTENASDPFGQLRHYGFNGLTRAHTRMKELQEAMEASSRLYSLKLPPAIDALNEIIANVRGPLKAVEQQANPGDSEALKVWQDFMSELAILTSELRKALPAKNAPVTGSACSL